MSRSSLRCYKSGKTHGGYQYYSIDINNLEKVSFSGIHVIYKCPWCNRDKLYYNFRKGVGLCFHCEIVVVDPNVKSKDFDLSQFSWVGFLDLSSSRDISWTSSALFSPECKIYLSLRKCDYDNSIIEKFNLRTFNGVSNEVVLLLPNDYPGHLKVNSFQTTVISKKSFGPKYLTYSDNKVVYYLDKLRCQDIILVEGIFDAISVTSYSESEFPACPLLGKSLSKSQERQIYRYLKVNKNLKRVFVVLDGEVEQSKKIRTCRQLLSLDSSLKVYYVNLPNALDPEEAVAENVFDTYLQKSKRVIS